jgi:hypothetical protein
MRRRRNKYRLGVEVEEENGGGGGVHLASDGVVRYVLITVATTIN